MLGNSMGTGGGSNLHTELIASVASLSSFIKWGVILSHGAAVRMKEE